MPLSVARRLRPAAPALAGAVLALALPLVLALAPSPAAAGTRAGTPNAADPAENRAYVAEAAKQAGAVQTASGLVFVEQRAGSGATPRPKSRVRVHYRGTLIDGREFDSSYARKTPAEFALDEVIPCWTEGLQRMREGGKARLVCPADTAYGSMGSPGSPPIPPHATLVFEVELLKITQP